jgi:hypothetical protein
MSGVGAVNVDRTLAGLSGVAVGLMIAVLYLRNTSLTDEALDHLRDGAMLLIVMSAAVSIWRLIETSRTK